MIFLCRATYLCCCCGLPAGYTAAAAAVYFLVPDVSARPGRYIVRVGILDMFCASVLFVSPVHPALLPVSPRKDGVHSLDSRSHRVGNKAECPEEQTHQLGSQLSNTPYYADSPKRHETAKIEKTKRTLNLLFPRQ